MPVVVSPPPPLNISKGGTPIFEAKGSNMNPFSKPHDISSFTNPVAPVVSLGWAPPI